MSTRKQNKLRLEKKNHSFQIPFPLTMYFFLLLNKATYFDSMQFNHFDLKKIISLKKNNKFEKHEWFSHEI